MPYKVEIADTEENNTFLKNIPKDILTKLSEHLQLLGKHPYLGRSIEAPIPAYLSHAVRSFLLTANAVQDDNCWTACNLQGN